MPELLTPPPSDTTETHSQITIRELNPDEWDRVTAELKPIPDGPLPANAVLPDPDNSSIIVAERDGEIVGFWMLTFMPHMEGFWLKDEPSVRNGRTIHRLIETTRSLLDKANVPVTFCWSSPEVGDLCRRVGMTRLEGVNGTPLETYLFETRPDAPHHSRRNGRC